MKKFFSAMVLISILGSTAACGRLMGTVRNDFDDRQYSDNGPVVGGRWAERGFLEESLPASGYRTDRKAAAASSDRAPSSEREIVSPSAQAPSQSWVGSSREIASERPLPAFQTQDENAPRAQTYYKNGGRATKADFIDDSQSEGSLWASNGQTNYYFSKNRVRGVGDIVSIVIEEDLVRDLVLEVKRSLDPAEQQIEMGIAQEKIRQNFYASAKDKKGTDSVQTNAAAPDRQPAAEQGAGRTSKEEAAVPRATVADIDLVAAVEIKAGETMLGEIQERYPNGNFRVRGTKRVRYKNGAPRLVTLLGVARAQDITEEDVLNSGKLYEYRLEAIR